MKGRKIKQIISIIMVVVLVFEPGFFNVSNVKANENNGIDERILEEFNKSKEEKIDGSNEDVFEEDIEENKKEITDEVEQEFSDVEDREEKLEDVEINEKTAIKEIISPDTNIDEAEKKEKIVEEPEENEKEIIELEENSEDTEVSEEKAESGESPETEEVEEETSESVEETKTSETESTERTSESESTEETIEIENETVEEIEINQATKLAPKKMMAPNPNSTIIEQGMIGKCTYEVTIGDEDPDDYVLTITAPSVSENYDDGTNFDNSMITSGLPWKGYLRTIIFKSNEDGNKVIPKTGANLFYACDVLANIEFNNNFDTSKVTDMSCMFSSCTGIFSFDLSSLDTSKVTNMSSMFYDCISLSSIDVSNMDTSNVELMNYMFHDCVSLTNLDVSNFDTSKATDMSRMFNGCQELMSLDVSKFNTSKVTSMGGMFNYCSSLTNLDLGNFDTSKVTYMSYMFSGCSSLNNLDLSSFDTSNVTDMGSMFEGCSSLTNLDLRSFNTLKLGTGSSEQKGQASGMSCMFENCYNLKKIYASELFNVSNVQDSDSAFLGCTSLEGGSGTKYNEAYVDKTYARIDAEGTPGYFSKAKKEFIVTFDPQNGTEFITKSVLENEKVSSPKNPTKSGWTFKEWRLNGSKFDCNQRVITSNITLIAYYTKNSSGGGGSSSSGGGGSSSGGVSSATILQGLETALPLNEKMSQDIEEKAAQQKVSAITLDINTSPTIVEGATIWFTDSITGGTKLGYVDANNNVCLAAAGLFNYTKTDENNNVLKATYYFNEYGDMQTGWIQTQDGNWYFFDNEKTFNEGKMCFGWKEIDGYWYYFNEDGTMVVGWKEINGYWYFFQEDGSMMVNGVTPDGYKINEAGTWVQ